jgi:hypothetical protein
VYGLNLAAEVIGHWWAMCFVFFVNVIAKGFALGIENDGNVRVIMAF